jgi:hypothetical protein
MWWSNKITHKIPQTRAIGGTWGWNEKLEWKQYLGEKEGPS